MGKQVFGIIVNFFKSLFTKSPAVKKDPPVPVPLGKPDAYKFILEIAKGEIGQKELRDYENGRILQYHDCTTLDASKDEVAWCFPGDHDILTERGWVKFRELSKSHGKVAQVIPNTMGIEWVNPIRYISQKYSGDLYTIKTRSFSVSATEEHLFYGVFSNTAEILEKRRLSEVTTAGISIPPCHTKSSGNKSFNNNDLCLLSAFLSDGFFHRGNIEIQVSRSNKIDILKSLLPSNIYTAKKAYGKSVTPLTTFSFDIPVWFEKIFSGYKVLNYDFILSLSKEQCIDFIKYYSKFDGHIRGNSMRLYSSSREQMDRLSMIATMAGYHLFEQFSISKLSGRKCYSIIIDPNKKYKHVRKNNISRLYKENIDVYCVEVPSGLIVIRSPDGTPMVTGNCSSFCNWVLLQFWMKYIPKTLATYAYRIPSNVIHNIADLNYLKSDMNHFPDTEYFGLKTLPTFSAAAKSWEKWGYELDAPVSGCIVVLTRPPDRSVNRHVAIFVEECSNKDFIYCLGGNQSDGVNIKPFKKEDVICYRGL